MRPRSTIRAAAVRGDLDRALLSSFAVAPVDHDLDRGVALEVLLEIVRQRHVAARDDEQEAVRRGRQRRGTGLTGLSCARHPGNNIAHAFPDDVLIARLPRLAGYNYRKLPGGARGPVAQVDNAQAKIVA